MTNSFGSNCAPCGRGQGFGGQRQVGSLIDLLDACPNLIQTCKKHDFAQNNTAPVHVHKGEDKFFYQREPSEVTIDECHVIVQKDIVEICKADRKKIITKSAYIEPMKDKGCEVVDKCRGQRGQGGHGGHNVY